MRLRDPRPWIALASLALVLTAVRHSLERTSPGPVAAAHAQDERLEGGGACDRCHGGLLTSMDEACSDCHVEIGEQLARGDGLHGSLDDAAHCARCHGDHHGEEFELVGERSFMLAGFASRSAFEHVGLALAVDGEHAALECVDCHAHADDRLLVQGTRRFLGLDATCGACHDDPHEGRMTPGCAECHDEAHAFDDLSAFAHTDGLALEGGHADPGCLDCHPRGGAHSVEALVGPGPRPSPRECTACHDDVHRAGFARGVAELTGTSEGESCASCHDARARGFAGDAATCPEELHAASGFPLSTPHDRATCADCHAPGGAAYPGRVADDCAACHADPHAGQFAGTSCLDCHERHAFLPVGFGSAEHAATAFPLEGAHASTECASCHLAPHEDAATVFRGTSRRCDDCHADAHAGAFADASGCGECHAPSSFAANAPEGFAHGRWTSFPLEGAHASADCESCHARSAAPDEFGRTFGRIAELVQGPADACESCHADAHGERFGSRPRCGECHDPTSFHVARESFAHGDHTAFPLRGAHGELSCEVCHPRALRPDAAGRTLGWAHEVYGEPVGACATCHSDPHGGAFDRAGVPPVADGRTGCARCHDERSFAPLSDPFDHAAWTGYAIDGPHAGLDCGACHAPTPMRRHGPAAGTSCNDCHGDPHVGQFARDGATDCARCHADAVTLVFDHRSDARFALDATHAALDCADCHVPWPLPGGDSAVRYKPLGTECSDCHAPGGGR